MSLTTKSLTPCTGPHCGSYRAGHQIHFIHANHVGRTPWGWRDAVVTAITGLTVHLAYVDHDSALEVWHHQPLADTLAVGDPVRLHEQYYVLDTPSGWHCVRVLDGGLGDVPTPEQPALWAPETTNPIVDLATGVAITELPRVWWRLWSAPGSTQSRLLGSHATVMMRLRSNSIGESHPSLL
ncbi:hypothetical protein [Nocardioides rubriscoriae]|uniref:hypothetical protein n=1 Tax=Nocardioides rubriscoriae TaxID=642762 RepID=UPI0011DF5FA7|nr:hypothetical protein [Nocardioides rubriscoriae]